MNALLAMALGTVPLFTTGVSLAQRGRMMDRDSWEVGWMGGYGGISVPIVLALVAVGVAAWMAQRKGK